jgi:hypothetical protein
MSTIADEVIVSADGNKINKKKRKVRHYRTPLCSFTAGSSFNSGGGDRKVGRYATDI